MNGIQERSRLGHIAALLLAAFALAFAGCLALAAPAQAETVSTFSVNAKSEVSVSAYLVFKADIDDATNGASNVEWASEACKSAVLAFLDKPAATTGGTTAYGKWLYDKGLASIDLTGRSSSAMTAADREAHDRADNAMAFIAEEIASSSGVTKNSTLITADGSFSNNLADTVKALGATQTQTVSGTAASFTNLEEGFYLFSAEGSAPVWAPVGGSVSQVSLKTDSILTLEKQVLDDETNTYGKLADTGTGDQVEFKVTGTLPKTAPASGVSYSYKLEDKLPEGLTYVANSLKVETDNNIDLTSSFTVTDSGTLTAACSALPYSSQSDLSSATQVIFTYKANLTSSATMGATFNTNEAKLIYGEEGEELETESDSANVATYELDILKESSEDGSALAGAKFTIKKGEKYLQADGTLSDAEYEFETDSSGKIAVKQIDDGNYTVKETKAPSGYSLPAVVETDVVITATKDVQAGTLDNLTATATNNVPVTADTDSGVVAITIQNKPATVLPITGMTPNQLGTVLGALLVAAGVIALVVRSAKRKGRQS